MVYMQKRSLDMESLPGYFGFWGGHAEGGETAEEALGREIKEELGIDLDMRQVEHFNHYEFFRSIKDIYLLNVENHWEDRAVIGEGDYGVWLTIDEALKRADIIFEDKVVLNDLDRSLLQKPIQ